MPDTPAARTFFASTFGGTALVDKELKTLAIENGVKGANDWTVGTSPHLMQGTRAIYLVDGLANESPAKAASDARVMAPSSAYSEDFPVYCASVIFPPPECEGWTEEDETIPDSPPEPESDPTFHSYETEFSSELVQCQVGTDYPHLSTTAGYVGNINVKSWNRCTAPVSMQVQSSLKRQSCFFWVFCTWPTVAQSVPYANASAMQVIAPATMSCVWSDGWYRGSGYHVTIALNTTHISRTATEARRIQCL